MVSFATCSFSRIVTASGAFEPDLEKWDPWRPEQVARLLTRVEAPWYVAGGWAIDLFLREERREREDIEIAVPADRFTEVLEALAGFELFAAGVPRPGFVTPLAQAGDALETSHQTWVREPPTDRWRLDVFREPSDGDTWICRRHEDIRLPYDQVIERSGDGIPYGRPEIILLFKAKPARPKDDDDLAAVLPLLDPERRRWLAEALELIHPGHRWLPVRRAGSEAGSTVTARASASRCAGSRPQSRTKIGSSCPTSRRELIAATTPRKYVESETR